MGAGAADDFVGVCAAARTAGYCKARKRLPQGDLDSVHARVARGVRSEHLARGVDSVMRNHQNHDGDGHPALQNPRHGA